MAGLKLCVPFVLFHLFSADANRIIAFNLTKNDNTVNSDNKEIQKGFPAIAMLLIIEIASV